MKDIEIIIWYEDQYGKRYELITSYKNFKKDAVIILEKYLDKCYKLYYTMNNETKELDYYNLDEI